MTASENHEPTVALTGESSIFYMSSAMRHKREESKRLDLTREMYEVGAA